MKNPVFTCKYRHDGEDHILNGGESRLLKAETIFNDDSVKVTINPLEPLELLEAYVEFDFDFNEDDRIYSGGYQSWSTTREYKKTDVPIDYGELITALKAEKYASISGDGWFCEPVREKGVFKSHCYTYVKNNEQFKFFGSLSEKQGFTVFICDTNKGKIKIFKDVEGVTVNEPYNLFDIAVLNGSEDDVFQKYFDLMGVKPPKIDHLAGYTSWYNYFQNINEDIILRDLDAMDPVKDYVNVFQIDDGYETYIGDWTDENPSKFPEGMKYIADKIHEKGYLAGIWIAPFNVQIKSRTYKEHPDWVIKDKKGRPVLGSLSWGGAYTLDIYNDEARDHIKHFFNVILNDWGFDMVKLDFLFSQCQIPRNNKSRGAIMCEAMDFLRECCGDKLILGCGAPLGAAFGKVDACRISSDVGLTFRPRIYNKMNLSNEMVSTRNAMISSIFRRQLNGRAFVNDPDVFFLRYSNLKFNMDQKLLLAFINHLCGDVLFVSDDMNEYKPADFDAVKKLYSKSQFKVIDANFVDENRVIIKLLDSDGKFKMLWFGVENGFSNQSQISGLSPKR